MNTIRITVEVTPRVRRLAMSALLVGLVGTVATAHATWSTDPATWMVGDGTHPISASKLKKLFDETDARLSGLEAPALTRAHTDSAITVPYGVPTTIVYEDVNFGTNLNVSTGQYTCPATGKYRVSASVRFNAATMTDTQSAFLELWKNTDVYAQLAVVNAHPGAGFSLIGASLVDCAKDETLQIKAYLAFNVGTSAVLTGDPAENWLSVERVGD